MKWLATILFSLCGLFLTAQQKKFYSERYTTRDGLSHNEVTCLFKDSRNLLWVGTEFGLNMFDGNSFTTFFNTPGDTNSLVHNKIMRITEDRQRNLWIGTQNGVSCFNLLSRKFINYSRLKKGPFYLDIENCYAYVGKDGSIWIGHNKGIIHLDPATGQSQAYELPLSPPQEYRNRYVSDFFEDEQNDLWAATSLGVYRLKKNGTHFQSFRFPKSYPNEFGLNACTKFATDKHGTLYCGTWNAGIIFFDKVTRQFKHLESGSKMNNNTVFDICFEDNVVWTASLGALCTISSDDLLKETRFDWKVNPDIDGSQPISAYDILRDKNSLWFATEKGLLAMKTSETGIANYSFSNINNWTPLSIVESGAQRLQICNGLCLMSYDLANKTAAKKIDTKFPTQLIRTANGYWLTAQPGLYRLNNNLQVQEIITHRNANNEPEGFGYVYEDPSGVVWLSCGRKGLRQYDPKTKQWSSFFDKTETGFRQITADKYGNIWLAHSLIRYNQNKKAFEKIGIKNPFFDSTEVNSVSSIFPAGDTIWIGTYAGLYYYDYKNDTVFNIQLPSNISARINGVIADKSGHLWLESKGKLVMYDIARKVFKVFNEADGFSGEQMSSRFTVLQNGNIIVGYNGGFAIIDPLKLPPAEDILIPEFTKINIDDHSIDMLSAGSSIKYNQSISFNFVSPSYNSGGRNQYAYQLQPIDNEWNFIGSNSTQRFTKLPQGKYIFRVRAGNAAGTWNEQASTFAFIVKPPFWKTWWFISLSVVVISLIVYMVYRYRLQQVLRMERMRTKIATDLHDDIGATLSSISMYSDAVKEQIKTKLPHLEPVLEKMGENSRTMVGSMSDIVWAINPDNDEGEKLIHRMESYAKDLCALKNVRLQFNIDERIDNIKLSLEQRKNIYLVFKESINNALKYSACTMIETDIVIHNKRLTLKIKDNGKGFNVHNRKGNGLKNMELRVAEIKGHMNIESSEAYGTRVLMNCPIA